MCEQCVFHSIGATDYDAYQPRFGFKCAICRVRYRVSPRRMKAFMAKFESTTHSKEMPCCCPDDCGKIYRVTHLACSAGCYDCDESDFRMELVSIHEDLDMQSDDVVESEEEAEEGEEEDVESVSVSGADSNIEEETGVEVHVEATAIQNHSLDEMD